MAEMKLLVGVGGVVVSVVTAAVFTMIMGQILLSFLGIGVISEERIHIQTIIATTRKNQFVQFIIGNIKLPLRVIIFGSSKDNGFSL